MGLLVVGVVGAIFWCLCFTFASFLQLCFFLDDRKETTRSATRYIFGLLPCYRSYVARLISPLFFLVFAVVVVAVFLSVYFAFCVGY